MFKKIYSSIYQFVFGMFYNFRMIVEIPNILNKYCIKNFVKIFLLNIILLNMIDFFYSLLDQINVIFLKYFFIIVYSIAFYGPIYIFNYIFTFDKINNILTYCTINENKIGINLNNSIYFSISILMLYLITSIFNYFSLVGIFINIIVNSFVYGFYCFDSACGIKNINGKEKLALFEKNIIFLVGYGSLFGFISFYLNTIFFSIIFCFIFPLAVFNLVNLNIYKLETRIFHSKFFYLPVSMSNLFLSIIDSYLISYYNVNKIKED